MRSAIGQCARSSRHRIAPVVVIAAVSAVLTACVERMFFYPDAVQYARAADFGLASEDVYFASADGSRLHGWFIAAVGVPRGTVLHLHGNAANISNHLPLVAWLPRAGYNVFLFDYRGFGKSAGTPTLDGVVEDGRAALAYLRTRRDVDANRLAVYGHSLGGATALRLLAQDHAGVRIAIIESAFASYRDIAGDALRSSLLLTLLRPLALTLPASDLDPITALPRIDIPLVFVHGDADRVVPFAHGERLFAAAGEPKQWLAVAGADHMEAGQRPDVQARLRAALDGQLP